MFTKALMFTTFTMLHMVHMLHMCDMLHGSNMCNIAHGRNQRARALSTRARVDTMQQYRARVTT